jgi:hypothetical protein
MVMIQAVHHCSMLVDKGENKRDVIQADQVLRDNHIPGHLLLIAPTYHIIAVYYYYYYYYSTGFHNPLAGFSLLGIEVSRSHARTHHSR